MNSSTDLQDAIARILEAPGVLGLSHPVVRRKEKDFKNDLLANEAVQKGLCVFAMAPLPTSALEGVPFVFFDGYEVRVRIVELPNINNTGVDAYGLIDKVATALHWQPKAEGSPLAGMLAHPLELARRPVETAEAMMALPGTGFEKDEHFVRVVDVIFNAVMGVNQE